jgi:hypothetical protein
VTEEALADGYHGLRMSADVTDLVRAPEQQDAFARCEFLLERYSSRHLQSAMCEYRRELGDAVTQFACMHAAVPAGLTPFQVFACDDGAVGLLGEFDQASQIAFERALRRIQLAPDDSKLIFDMSAVRFMDHRALLALDSYAQKRQIPVFVRSMPPIVPPGSASSGPGASGSRAHGRFVMRTGVARGHVGHFHEAGFYGSDAEFRALIVPFAEEGIAAGEPVIIGYDGRKNALVQSWLTDPSAVTFLADSGVYATPTRAIAAYRRLFELHVAQGAGQIRISGELPHPGNGGRFDGWDRYEAAVNTVWQDFPVWGLCLYDTANSPAALLDVAERTHPRIVSPSGTRRANGRFQQVADFQALPPSPIHWNRPRP